MSNMDTLNKRHGGYRPGAGAKKTLKDPIRITIVLERIQYDWLLEQGPASPLIRKLVTQAMENNQ